jgi:hypothetical protein
MDDLTRLLGDADYPATKDELIDVAVEADAPQDVIEQFQSLSREQYEDAAEVERELSGSD